jgi:RNA polymerase sigma-70 factor (ECF subfamily)
MTDLGELTQAAAAEHLGLSVPGMKARVQRGRLKLAEMLRDCCVVATDRRGRPTEYETNEGGCECGSDATTPGAAAGCCSPGGVTQVRR